VEGSPLTFSVLGSGSNGNSYLFDLGEWAFLVDNGFPLKDWQRRMAKEGIDPLKIRMCFLTHTHGDHYRGIPPMVRRYNIPLLIHEDIAGKVAQEVSEARIFSISQERSYQKDGLRFFPIKLQHDSPGTLGFLFTYQGFRIGLISDTGDIPQGDLAPFSELDLLFIEANYCPKMLDEGPYPPFLKRRIRGSRGHLSNQRSIEIVNFLGHQNPRLKQVYFCHLSDSNNSPLALQEELDRSLDWQGEYQICLKGESYRGSLSQEVLLGG